MYPRDLSTGTDKVLQRVPVDVSIIVEVRYSRKVSRDTGSGGPAGASLSGNRLIGELAGLLETCEEGLADLRYDIDTPTWTPGNAVSQRSRKSVKPSNPGCLVQQPQPLTQPSRRAPIQRHFKVNFPSASELVTIRRAINCNLIRAYPGAFNEASATDARFQTQTLGIALPLLAGSTSR